MIKAGRRRRAKRRGFQAGSSIRLILDWRGPVYFLNFQIEKGVKGLEGKGKERKCPWELWGRSSRESLSIYLLLSHWTFLVDMRWPITWPPGPIVWGPTKKKNFKSRISKWSVLPFLLLSSSTLTLQSSKLSFGNEPFCLNGGGILFLTSIRIRSLVLAYRSGWPRIRKGALVD